MGNYSARVSCAEVRGQGLEMADELKNMVRQHSVDEDIHLLGARSTSLFCGYYCFVYYYQ